MLMPHSSAIPQVMWEEYQSVREFMENLEDIKTVPELWNIRRTLSLKRGITALVDDGARWVVSTSTNRKERV